MSPSGFPNYPTSLHYDCVPYYYGSHDDICFHLVLHLFQVFGSESFDSNSVMCNITESSSHG